MLKTKNSGTVRFGLLILNDSLVLWCLNSSTIAAIRFQN